MAATSTVIIMADSPTPSNAAAASFLTPSIGAPTASKLDIPAGSILETPDHRYTVEQKLGAGSFGSVWLCQESSSEEKRAVKLLHNDCTQDWLQEVVQTERALHAAGESFVPKFFEASQATLLGLDSKHLLIAMEFIDGSAASTLAARYILPWKAACTMLADVLTALCRLHHLNIIHRDLKGDNVVVSRTGSSYLCDFAISGTESELRGTRTVAGTPDFMSPELLGDWPQFTPKADIWAFGVMGIQLATGSTPFQDDEECRTASERFAKTATGMPPTVPRLEAFPTVFTTSLEKCLQRDAASRPTAEQLLCLSPFKQLRGDAAHAAVRQCLEKPTPRPGAHNLSAQNWVASYVSQLAQAQPVQQLLATTGMNQCLTCLN